MRVSTIVYAWSPCYDADGAWRVARGAWRFTSEQTPPVVCVSPNRSLT